MAIFIGYMRLIIKGTILRVLAFIPMIYEPQFFDSTAVLYVEFNYHQSLISRVKNFEPC